MVSRRFLLGGLFASAIAPSQALSESTIRSIRPVMRGASSGAAGAVAGQSVADVGALIRAANLTGQLSYVVADAATGHIFESHQPDVALPPASVVKALTSLYALERLGPSRSFATRLLATGPVQGGILRGDLILAGGGDTTLQTDQLGDLLANLARSGLQGITGRFLYWDGALPQLSRVAQDQPDHVGYNPAISGLNLNFNRVHFEWRRAGGDWRLTMDARGERFTPKVTMADVQIAQRDSPLFTYRATADQDHWTVASGALGKGGARWLPVRLPGLYTAEVFRTLARAKGIDLPWPQPTTAQPGQHQELARIDSEPLTTILADMLRFSTNITAEGVGLAASGQANVASSAQDMTAWLRQSFGISGAFADHSGLGGGSRMTAIDMAQVLLTARAQKRGLREILRDVGMKDATGKVIKNHPVKVLAKTGTLNFVSSLAGHIVPPQGRELIFAVFAGDPARRDAIPVSQRENPAGSPEWVKSARILKGQLVTRWAQLYTDGQG